MIIDQRASDEYRIRRTVLTNKKHLSWVNEEPKYTEFVPVGAKPYTLFKSIYTNNTNRKGSAMRLDDVSGYFTHSGIL
ncbi:hypothetical protein NECAME_12532 [Necator americanus]|uniref:Uncharacterized protein n=1 Tax=Necator americanus TaxID=51031 RepID=W2T237_NECAM|nr:hypothetical protein NECAME_12532 [Necator americanus]ETN75047.1 hypothetical protein NECAME_12532 [Necator americanus]